MKNWVTWNYTWGPQLDKLKELEAAGMRPQALRDEPELGPVEDEVVHAFNVLGSRRTHGLDRNPIQLSEIVAFTEIFGQPAMPMWMFVRLIGEMDTTFRSLASGDDKPTS